mmetsp:Transcript_14418/g.21470  ORF Transcript_14418/g.21470 Transcript_14418/m.21470 type:complete len:493 (+) Transcript_14418:175-1653(+)|eukprot:CAMPEP_0194083784 /NCGR_PEP_ID=MMETSP0149-20130528/9757_1 /TAXON_ID=122233 /ORGANISM="Chaetoceros debilis, Strain MM31A-1" /LENGTH=492 /DNA_ID=CAMNT_0038766239 /DNA_START=181 /DNA_END=1659 /DNA_ORIENTATION=-
MFVVEENPCSTTKKKIPTCDRLYDLAKKKRELEDSRKKAHKEEQFKRDMKPRKLILQSKRSYTPQRERNYNEGQNIHTRLYSMAGSKKAALEKATLEKEKKYRKKKEEEKLNSSIQTSKRSERLYGQSLRMQLDGRQRREQISEKHKKRAPKTFGKISVDDATNIYQRGMMMKVELEAKRQDNSLSPYVSPLLNPIVLEDDVKANTYTSREKPLRSPASRCRSQTPSKKERDLTSPPMSSRRSVSRSRTGASERGRTTIVSNDVMKNPRIPSQNRNVRSSSRIRSRSRLRDLAQHQPSLRSPSPKVMRINAGTSSNPWSVPGLAEIKRANTPKRLDRQHSMKDMLRRMEEDVSFYNDLKKAASMVESRDDSEDIGLSFDDDDEDDETEAERPKELPENVEISTLNLGNGASPENTPGKQGRSPNTTLLNVDLAGNGSNLSNLSNDREDSKDEYAEGRDGVEGDGDGDKSAYFSQNIFRSSSVHPQSTEILHV